MRARAALFLCGDDAQFITGVCMEVDGGRCIKSVRKIPLLFTPFDLIALRRGGGQAARLVVGHAPLAIFKNKDIRGDEAGAAKVLVADDKSCFRGDDNRWINGAHMRGIARDKNPVPGFHHRITRIDARPVRMEDGDITPPRPEAFHGLEVGSPECGVKSLVGGQNCLFFRHVFIGSWRRCERQPHYVY